VLGTDWLDDELFGGLEGRNVIEQVRLRLQQRVRRAAQSGEGTC
jgi:hypothetical protein